MEQRNERPIGTLNALTEKIALDRKRISLIGEKIFPSLISGTRGQLPPGARGDDKDDRFLEQTNTETETETETRTNILSIAVSPDGRIYATDSLAEAEARIPLKHYPKTREDDLAFSPTLFHEDSPAEPPEEVTQLDDLVEAASRSHGGFVGMSTEEFKRHYRNGEIQKPGLARLLEIWALEEQNEMVKTRSPAADLLTRCPLNLQQLDTTCTTIPRLAGPEGASSASPQFSSDQDTLAMAKVSFTDTKCDTKSGDRGEDLRPTVTAERGKRAQQVLNGTAPSPAHVAVVSTGKTAKELPPATKSAAAPVRSSTMVSLERDGTTRLLAGSEGGHRRTEAGAELDSGSKTASPEAPSRSKLHPKLLRTTPNSHTVLTRKKPVQGKSQSATPTHVSVSSSAAGLASRVSSRRGAILPAPDSAESEILKSVCDQKKSRSISISLGRRRN